MSIEKAFFGYVVDCDYCSEFLNCDVYDDFKSAIDMVKDKGWKIRKEDDEWVHICPVCAEKRKE